MSIAAACPRIASRGDYANHTDPLDVLAAEHGVLRAACASLERIAVETRPRTEAARSVAMQLRAILPRHMADEDEFLFPLLRQRAEPDDEIERVHARLAVEHDEGGSRLQEILAMLDRLALGESTACPAERAAIGTFAAAKLRHLSLETAIVLPLARKRLSAGDRADLRAAMARRDHSEAVTA